MSPAHRQLSVCLNWAAAVLLAAAALAAQNASPSAEPTPEPPVQAEKSIEEEAAPAQAAAQRTQLNLLGVTDAKSGESRRNENVQFDLIDNNALRELNARLGATATIVREFRPESSYFGSEFGKPSGRPPLLQVGSAIDAIHGNLYWAHDNSALRARSFFQVGDVQPARDNDYGVTVAAPLWSGAGLTLSASQQKLRGQVNGNVLVPRADERTPLATDPATRAIVSEYLSAYPTQAPNRTDINERALNTNAPQVIDNDNFSGRLDQALSADDKLFASYRYTAQSLDAFQLVDGQNPDTDTRAHFGGLTWSRSWSPRIVSDLGLSFDRVGSLLRPEPNNIGPFVNTGGAIERLGPGPFIPIDEAQNRFTASALVRVMRDHHSWTFGATALRRQVNGSRSLKHIGEVTFGNAFGNDAITNIRLGRPLRYDVAFGDPHRGFRNTDFQAFLGDDWRTTSHLALHFALRYSLSTAPTEANDLTSFSYDCDCNNLGPQFGFAYELPNGWGRMRGAYGVHFGEIFPVTFGQGRFNPPDTIIVVVAEPNLADPLEKLSPADIAPNARSTVLELDPNLVLPYSQQYNFSWEPMAFGPWRLQLGYVGSRSTKLLDMWVYNRAHPVEGVPQTSATINERRADPRYFEIRRVVNGSRGYFDAGRATLILPQRAGFSLNASYWFSKSIDIGAPYTSTAAGVDAGRSRSQNEFDVVGDKRSLSNFDQPHAFVVRGAYETPRMLGQPRWMRAVLGSWNVSGVMLLKSGTPFTLQSGSDGAGFGNVDGSTGDRINVVDPSVLGREIGNPDTSRELLPASAFAFISPNEPRGNIGMNTFRKGDIRNVNLSIAREWRVWSDDEVAFRAESINVLNTPQFAEPGRQLASQNFGQITNTLNDGRSIRFRLDLRF